MSDRFQSTITNHQSPIQRSLTVLIIRKTQKLKGHVECVGVAEAAREHTRTEPTRSKRSQGKQEHTVDALVLCGDEGRGELRKAPGSCKQAESRGYPNGGTCRPMTTENSPSQSSVSTLRGMTKACPGSMIVDRGDFAKK